MQRELTMIHYSISWNARADILQKIVEHQDDFLSISEKFLNCMKHIFDSCH